MKLSERIIMTMIFSNDCSTFHAIQIRNTRKLEVILYFLYLLSISKHICVIAVIDSFIQIFLNESMANYGQFN